MIKYKVRHEGAYDYLFQDDKEIGATEAVKKLNELEGLLHRAQNLLIRNCRKCVNKGEEWCGRCEAMDILGARFTEIFKEGK